MRGEPLARLVLAHRGDHRSAPENTIDAFRAALAIPGCSGVELDVRTAGDGTPIVLHDATLARIQGDPRRALDLSRAELAGLGVACFADVLEGLPVHAFLDVELKDHGAAAMVSLLAATRGDPPRGVAISSFDPLDLQAIRDLRPGWPTWLNTTTPTDPVISRARAIGCRGISALWSSLAPDTVRRAHASGLVVIAWTVTEVDVLERLARMGIDGVCAEGAALDAASGVAWAASA